MPVLNGTAVKVLNATNATEGGTGVYNHAPMISLHSGVLLLSWKNAPSAEDVPGQGMLYSYASAERRRRPQRARLVGARRPLPELPTWAWRPATRVMARAAAQGMDGTIRQSGHPSPTPGATALYALPTAVLNGRVYRGGDPIKAKLLPILT